MTFFRTEHMRQIARKGAIARYQRYGNPGTIEGRRKGGLNSVKSNLLKRTGFKTRTPIRHPKNSVMLAELLGIMIGDGHLSQYWASVTTNSETDREHAEYVRGLISKLFGVHVQIRKEKDQHAVTVLVTAKNVVDFLHSKGMPIGNKMNAGLTIPSWIVERESFQKAFLRGLFDTDGSVYQDFRTIKGKRYTGLCMLFSSASESLRNDVRSLLTAFGYEPTGGIGKHRSIYLRKKANIVRYFSEIGTSNPKHRGRFQKFDGGVA